LPGQDFESHQQKTEPPVNKEVVDNGNTDLSACLDKILQKHLRLEQTISKRASKKVQKYLQKAQK